MLQKLISITESYILQGGFFGRVQKKLFGIILPLWDTNESGQFKNLGNIQLSFTRSTLTEFNGPNLVVVYSE